MLGSCVRNDFPVVDSLVKSNVAKKVSKNVIILFQVDGPSIGGYLQSLRKFFVGILFLYKVFKVPFEV